VPLSNDVFGPLVLGDVNDNGRTDVYGIFKDYTTEFIARVYEIDSNGTVSPPLYNYLDGGISHRLTDVNQNGLVEYVLQSIDTALFFEQQTPTSLPTQWIFSHIMFEHPAAIGTRIHITNLDGDSFTDFLYRGTEADSTHPNGWQYYTYVAEFNPSINNFQRVWQTQLWAPNGESGIGGYDVGDYDGDGRMDFLASGLWGQVWVVENIGDNTYQLAWTDTLPFVNVFYQTSGDVDNDGKREFFVGATMSNGNWTMVFEADSNNVYSPKFLFHLLSGGTGDEPTYLTTDVDGNGRLELVIMSGAYLYIFKSDADDSYYLWYLKREETPWHFTILTGMDGRILLSVNDVQTLLDEDVTMRMLT
jgi:hypothetical protein